MGTATHPRSRPRPQRRPRHLAVALIGVVLLALTGCSGGTPPSRRLNSP